MAAAIKALNAKIRSNKYTDYFCSTRTFYPDPHAGYLRKVEEEVDMSGNIRNTSERHKKALARSNGLTRCRFLGSGE